MPLHDAAAVDAAAVGIGPFLMFAVHRAHASSKDGQIARRSSASLPNFERNHGNVPLGFPTFSIGGTATIESIIRVWGTVVSPTRIVIHRVASSCTDSSPIAKGSLGPGSGVVFGLPRSACDPDHAA